MPDIHKIFADFFKEEPPLDSIAYELSQKLEQGTICLAESELPKVDQQAGLKFAGLDEMQEKPLIRHQGYWYLHKYFQYETDILEKLQEKIEDSESVMASRINALNNQSVFLEELCMQVKESGGADQLGAAINAYLENFSLLTGGPGTGKTTSIRLLLYVLNKLEPQNSVGLLAPTGKAAARMGESLRSESHIDLLNNTGFSEYIETLEPSTIHRAIHTKYRRNEKLVYDTIIIDESSMIDVSLLAKLLHCLKPQCRLVLLGDRNQLSAVEAGSVFGDLCKAFQVEAQSFSDSKKAILDRIPHHNFRFTNSSGPANRGLGLELKQSHRFSSDSAIGRLSQQLLQADADDVFSIGDQNDLLRIDNLESADFESFTLKFLEYIESNEIADALAALNQAKILCSLRHGPYGVDQINRFCEQILARNNAIEPNNSYYHNQPIMVNSNNYELNIFNGDQGIIRKDLQGNYQAYFARSAGHIQSVPVLLIDRFETAFASTIHKSQGSEYEHVCIILSSSKQHELLSRQLLYTAVTRAKKSIMLYGSDAVLNLAMSRGVPPATGIENRLRKAYGN